MRCPHSTAAPPVAVRGQPPELVYLTGAGGVGRGAIVGLRPALGRHVLQRASVDDGLKHMLVLNGGQMNMNHQQGAGGKELGRIIINEQEARS